MVSDSENSGNGNGEEAVPVHAVIVDASTFNFIDTQGVNTLLQVRLQGEGRGKPAIKKRWGGGGGVLVVLFRS